MLLSSRFRIPEVQHMVAVASGKGGVGKTTVAVNLALALSQNGYRVGIYDADLYGPNVPLMLGVSRKESWGGFVPVARSERLPYIEPLERFGLKVMSIGFIVADHETVTPDTRFAGHIIRQTLQDIIWGELDFLLLDLPPGTGEPVETLLRTIGLTGVLIVTTPQDLSLMDTSRSLGMFRNSGVPILGIIENMSSLTCPHCGELVEIFHRSAREWAVESEELDLLGHIPMNISISRGINKGHPLMQEESDSIEARAFMGLAKKLTSKLKGDEFHSVPLPKKE